MTSRDRVKSLSIKISCTACKFSNRNLIKKAKGRAYAREHFWYNHGHGAEKCVDYIEGRIGELISEQEKAG